MPDPDIFQPLQIATGAIWWVLILLIAAWLRPQKGLPKSARDFFLPGLALRLAGGILFGLTYYYYFGGGDTFEYYRATGMLTRQMMEHPEMALRYIFSEAGSSVFPNHPYFTQTSTLVVIKAGLPFSLLSGHSYWAITLGFGLMSYLGSWLFFQALVKFRPGSNRFYGIAILAVPSVMFWGGGFLKDSLCLGLLGLTAYGAINLGFLFRKGLVSALLLFLGMIGLLTLKFYLGILWALAVGVVLIKEGVSKIPNKKVRLGILFAGLISVIAIMVLFPQLPVKILTYQQWHMAVLESRQAGSTYSLGTLPLSWWGLIQSLPLATATAFTGPYFWQWKHPLIAIAGLESLAIICFTVWALAKAGIKQSVHRLFSDPWLLLLLVFSLGGFFIAGLFGQNFGSVVRYRMPFLPFFLLGIWELYVPKRKPL